MFKSITKAAVMAVVAGGLNLAVVAPAQAQTIGPAEGLLCGFGSVTDPTIENGEVQTGELDGGPLVATDPLATISMKCTIQVGAANAAHNGADSASAASAPTLQATAVPPTLVSYSSPPGQPVFMCTEATINGAVWYYDSINDVWSPSSAVGCSEAISQEIFPGPLGPVLEELDKLVFCPALVALAPTLNQTGVVQIDSTGDTYINGEFFWDCQPYAS